MKHANSGRQVVFAMVALTILISGCGGTSKVAALVSPSSAVASPSPSPSPSLAQPSYSVHLTFTGGLSATVTKTQTDSSSSCGAGRIAVNFIYNGQAWSMSAAVDGYHGPARYDTPSFNLMLSAPSYDIWMSTGGSATYSGDTSLSADVTMTNLMAGPGEPGATAHISGTINC